MKEIRQDQQDNQDCFVSFRFPDETGNTQSASPLARDDRSHLKYTIVDLRPRISYGSRCESSTHLSPQAIGSWLLLPATAEDNKKINSIL
jgi:hypothetical protein